MVNLGKCHEMTVEIDGRASAMLLEITTLESGTNNQMEKQYCKYLYNILN